jgi:hypothetical protein
MSSPQPTTPQTSELDHEPAEQDEWLDEPEQLPRRPRRRLLTPVPLALLAALLVTCGFIGGVLVQKGQGATAATSGAGASGGFASRLAALKGAAPGAGAGATGGAGSAGGSGSRGGAGAFPGFGGSGGDVTTGEVAYVRGDTLYVTDSQGNTVKVNASAAAKVTKTVSTKAKSIHPGSTVVVLGSKAGDGSISATSISVSSAASGSATGSGASSSRAGSDSAPTTLFGPG